MRAVTIREGGELAVAEHPDPEPGAGEVLVRVRAAGINGADILQRRGAYPPPPGSPPDIPGLELAGEVAALGPGARRFQPGDRVMGIVGGGGQAELAVVHERQLMPVPEALGWPAAGALPEVFTTAHDALFTQSALRPGERLLVHGAAGGVGTAGDAARLTGFERVYDLFCGIGTIALTLAPRAGEVWGLEVAEAAIADAIRNARENEIANARFFAGDVRLALRELVELAGRPDVVVVDPPRAGLSAKVVRRIVEAAPKRIVYVSCNPTTLAPNAAQLVEAGYALGPVRPVDMFPQTPHIECVAVFDRKP